MCTRASFSCSRIVLLEVNTSRVSGDFTDEQQTDFTKLEKHTQRSLQAKCGYPLRTASQTWNLTYSNLCPRNPLGLRLSLDAHSKGTRKALIQLLCETFKPQTLTLTCGTHQEGPLVLRVRKYECRGQTNANQWSIGRNHRDPMPMESCCPTEIHACITACARGQHRWGTELQHFCKGHSGI